MTCARNALPRVSSKKKGGSTSGACHLGVKKLTQKFCLYNFDFGFAGKRLDTNFGFGLQLDALFSLYR